MNLLSDGELRLFRDLIYQECGISLGVEKRAFLESRLRRRMDELGLKNAYEYYSIVTAHQGQSQELPALLDSLMICETSFFRNQPQFDLLRDVVLPEIVQRKERDGIRLLRLWSAGCSTGQEPYSAVMTILDSLPEVESWTLRVFASDLSFTALERAQCGLYRADQLKNVDQAFTAKYFHQDDGYYVMSESIRKRVIFDYHNLKHDNGLRGLDIIFCRNVMIYFDRAVQQRVTTMLQRHLQPEGYLFISHSESLNALDHQLRWIAPAIYQRGRHD